MSKIISWSDIPKFPIINYNINVPLDSLNENLDHYKDDFNLDMNPDFQRAHVWTEQQQIDYMEYLLMEPQSPQMIIFNHPDWMSFREKNTNMVLLDGKQRLHAALRWLNNEIPAHGHYLKDFTHITPKYPIRRNEQVPFDIGFLFVVMKIKTREEILNWYINFNAGGTPHTKDEINQVKILLQKENKNELKR